MNVWVDGQLVDTEPAGHGPFETLGAVDHRLPLWDLHIERLQRAAARLSFRCALPPDLRATAEALLADHRCDVLRLSLVRDTAGAVHQVLQTRRRTATPAVRLILAPEPGPQTTPPPDLKCTPRDFYDRALAAAHDVSADDALILDPAGNVLETAHANVFFRAGGVWHTPALDGTLLPGIARGLLLEALAARKTAVVEGRHGLPELRAAEALVVTNAVHGPRPARLVDPDNPVPHPADRPDPVADLAELWREILAARA